MNMSNENKIYSFQYIPENNTLFVQITGIFDIESHEIFKTDLGRAVREINNNQINILADLSCASVQPKEISKDSGYMLELSGYIRKVAIVVMSTIYKMQIQRSKAGSRMQYFDDVNTAREWLNE